MVMLAVGATMSLQAQIVRFGVRAGVNVNHLSLSGHGAGDNCAGFTGGIMAEINVPVIGLGFDVAAQYARLSADNEIAENKTPNYETEHFDFLQVPINLKYKIQIPAVSRIVAPYLFTGPTLNFNFSGHDTFKTFQTGWNVGLGVELIRHLQLGASYCFGMGNVYKDHGSHGRNSYWTATVGWLF